MSRKVWIHKSSFNLSRVVGGLLTAGFIFGLLLGAGTWESYAVANSRFTLALAQDRNRFAARRKFDEGEALQKQGTAESLRLAAKKYEEALPLWRAVSDRSGEAVTLNNIGMSTIRWARIRRRSTSTIRRCRFIAQPATAMEKPQRSTTSALSTIRWARIRRRSTSTIRRCRFVARPATAVEKPRRSTTSAWSTVRWARIRRRSTTTIRRCRFCARSATAGRSQNAQQHRRCLQFAGRESEGARLLQSGAAGFARGR